jgi:ribosomal protein S12 methylthiotransferase
LDLAEHKADGQKRLVVTGCMSQRYGNELAAEMPEVDLFLGTGNFAELPARLEGRVSPRLPVLQPEAHAHDCAPVPAASERVVLGAPGSLAWADAPRVMSQPSYSTYIKISEGCSNRCSFCVIPQVRGDQRSRTKADLCAELTHLIERGVVEVNLIAQDLCAYGKDLTPKANLAQLLRALDGVASEAGRPVWLRCLYAYPRGLTSEVMRVLANARCILPYLDIPLQHVSDNVLRRMRRGKGGASTKALIRRLRKEIPNLTLRTTFITGFPGETEVDFAELSDFIDEIRFERMGVFAYSREEGTEAAVMPDQVDPEVGQARHEALLARQVAISREQQRALVGRTLTVLVEGESDESELLLQGRHAGQAPEIDGLTYITAGTAAPGDLVEVEIDQAADYDLAGRIKGSEPAEEREPPLSDADLDEGFTP